MIKEICKNCLNSSIDDEENLLICYEDYPGIIVDPEDTCGSFNKDYKYYSKEEYAEIMKEAISENGGRIFKLSIKVFKILLKEYPYISGIESWYCCEGPKSMCWQDPFGEGIWSDSREDVKEKAFDIVKRCQKYCKNTGRCTIEYDNDEGFVHLYVFFRDILKVDYHIYLSKKDQLYCI